MTDSKDLKKLNTVTGRNIGSVLRPHCGQSRVPMEDSRPVCRTLVSDGDDSRGRSFGFGQNKWILSRIGSDVLDVFYKTYPSLYSVPKFFKSFVLTLTDYKFRNNLVNVIFRTKLNELHLGVLRKSF